MKRKGEDRLGQDQCEDGSLDGKWPHKTKAEEPHHESESHWTALVETLEEIIVRLIRSVFPGVLTARRQRIVDREGAEAMAEPGDAVERVAPDGEAL